MQGFSCTLFREWRSQDLPSGLAASRAQVFSTLQHFPAVVLGISLPWFLSYLRSH
jgi:hypothetical protein